MPHSEADRDQHFIGWLPMPRSFSRFLIPVAVGLIVCAVVLAVFVAWGQQSPGNGQWENEKTTTLVGIVYSEPYAMIRVLDARPNGQPISILLVESGKFGAKDRVRSHEGRPVRVMGTLLARDGWKMLELSEEPESLTTATLSETEQQRLRRAKPRDLGRVTLKGEIVDSKCYLGAMKPGGGKTHKGCAALCLRGGIPPLFVVAGSEAPYLLTDSDSRYIEHVGEWVELEGQLEQWDDFRVLKLGRAR